MKLAVLCGGEASTGFIILLGYSWEPHKFLFTIFRTSLFVANRSNTVNTNVSTYTDKNTVKESFSLLN